MTQAERDVEAMAEAMMTAVDRDGGTVLWAHEPEIIREAFRKQARAALSALERAPDVDGLARTIAQADFIWGLGEQGVMACAPDIAGKMFDESWADATSATRQKFLHIAQVVRASLSALEREPEIEKAAMAIAESMFDMTTPKGDGPFAAARLSANEMLLEKCRRAARAAAPFFAAAMEAKQ